MNKLFKRFLLGIITIMLGFSYGQTIDLKITILSTMVADYDYLGEWGFSAIIESDGYKLLFDTGSRENTVLENADSLGIDLSTVSHVFLSHNHLDHTGGLIHLRKKLMLKDPNALKFVHVGKGIFSERLSKGKNVNDFTQQKEILESLGIEFIYHEKPEEMLPNIWTTGVVPRVYNEKNWSGYREIIEDGKIIEDNIPEDQSIVINTDKGLVLVSGCGHAGIVNTLKHTDDMFQKSSDISVAIGGFHLFNKTDKDIKWTSKQMKKYGVKEFIGAHCTGIDAVYSIRKNNRMDRENCVVGAVGSIYDYEKGIKPGYITK
ncbi:MAG TPA: MBL fold metallo-hydrolase [Candidatus Marinimicrobia bacterium]|jgi:7,8-dihydropterin-6-yl-methyl-4-(beta-D-ribofuranosyl)aminobenzene 5'-phosphate synthase|nr:MBL fold metallo-hydrolase [Candidatus Neomarinimicrobiota bacterium]